MALSKAYRWLRRSSAAAPPPDGRSAWAILISDCEVLPRLATKSKIDAACCDLLDVSGRVKRGGKIALCDRKDYARLVVRQLRAKKVVLAEHAQVWAWVFVVPEGSLE